MDILRSIARLVTDGWNSSTDDSHPNDSQPNVEARDSRLGDSPTYADIYVTRAMLESFGLPTEVVLQILDHAQYEPVLKFTSQRGRQTGADMRSSVGAQVCIDADVLTQETIRTLKASKAKLKVKEIEFSFTSYDQGWTSEGTQGTFATSSWLEASILRPSNATSGFTFSEETLYDWQRTPEGLKHALSEYGATLVERPLAVEYGPQGSEGPYAWYLQGNRVSARNPPPYHVVWASDHHEGNEGAGSGEGFLEALKEGDKVLVWARAKVCQCQYQMEG
jgi:hypothetical protein